METETKFWGTAHIAVRSQNRQPRSQGFSSGQAEPPGERASLLTGSRGGIPGGGLGGRSPPENFWRKEDNLLYFRNNKSLQNNKLYN